MAVPPAALVRVAEAAAAADRASVRVLGRIVSYAPENDLVVLEDPCPGAQDDRVQVDVELVTPHEALQKGSLVSVIGEVNVKGPGARGHEPLIKARALVPMEGLDVRLYASALEIRRKFLKSQNLDSSFVLKRERTEEEAGRARDKRRLTEAASSRAAHEDDAADADAVVILD
ncbi:CST complex subunit TEN1 [Hondaea fermentalgiana]|uniref:CST complex subunit TEN1 n=1 Tax=Hondaea fermentalgiana TaxID=2315210 RepID=A0A2R5GAQ3_9STRA|nr:CST complex subunit TEN1 [Hondaea fermentalgiana]|eukprot:GBG28090.1 CST complex subunit TEN1 [Hondaea fermentalgiana]